MVRRALSLVLLLALWPMAAPARDLWRYVILHTDEDKLVLEGPYGITVVSAKTYCWEAEGFTEGSEVMTPDNLDACVSALLISRKGETCRVWCR